MMKIMMVKKCPTSIDKSKTKFKMRIPHEIKGGLTRLGIVVLAFLLIAFMVFPLQIYHFTLLNSGVSVVIAILVLV